MNRLLLFLLFFIVFAQDKLWAQSSKVLDSLFAIEKTLPDGSEKIKIYLLVAFQYSRTSPDKAKYYYQKAIDIGEQMGENVETSSAYSTAANFYNNIGEKDSADFFLTKAREKAEKANNNKSWANYYQNSMLIDRKRENYKTAIEQGKKALEYSSRDGQKINIAGAYLNLGNCYLDMTNFERAAQYYYQALKIFETIHHEAGKAFCYNNLGNLYKELKQHEESIKYARLSLALKQKANDNAGVATSYLLISENYQMLKNYQQALDYVNKSIALNKKLSKQYELINNYHLQARIFNGMKDTIQAIKSFDQAISIAKKLQNTPLINELQTEKLLMTSVALIPESTIQNIESKLSLSQQTNDVNARLNNLEHLAQLYYNKGAYQKAFDYQQEYYQLKNNFYGSEILKKIKDQEIRYGLERKEAQIKLLQKDKELRENQLQKQRIGIYASVGVILLVLVIAYLLFNRNKIIQEKKRLQELETMRANIASDLHDDVGSTLSSIQIMSNMLLQQSDEHIATGQIARNISEMSYKVANGFREILWSVNPAHDKLEAVVVQLRRLAAEMLSTHEIAFRFNVDLADEEQLLNPRQRKNLLMIFKEAINNARKYSGAKQIDIYIKQSAQQLSLKIEDNGCGFDMETAIKGNGLGNMQKRAEEINGQLVLKTRPGAGTSLSLIMHLP